MHAVRSGMVILVALLFACFLSPALAGTRRATEPAEDFVFPTVPIAFPVVTRFGTELRTNLKMLDEPRGFCGLGVSWIPRYWCGCGFGLRPYLLDVVVPIPDPLAVIADAYWKCRVLKLVVLNPEVAVEDYPAGYFASWVYEGTVIAGRKNTSDEAIMRAVFSLLTEAVQERDDPCDELLGEGAPEAIKEYREHTSFFPELMIEFVGGSTPVRIEIGGGNRVLLQAGDRWDVFIADRWTMAALRKLLTNEVSAEFARPF